MFGLKKAFVLVACLALSVVVRAQTADSGVLLLAFDDRNFGDWERAMPLFEKYGAHASFFMNGGLDPKTLEIVRKLSAAGHTIGSHGLRHMNVPDALDKMSAEEWWTREVAPLKRQMDAAKIPLKAFAYPNNRRTDASDAALLTRFARLRAGVPGVRPFDPAGKKQAGQKPLITEERLFFPAKDLSAHRVIGGIVVGEAYHIDIEEVLSCIRRAGERKEVFLLTSHGIAPNAKHIHMKTEWLERILAEAQKAGLRILGFDELPN